MSVNSHLAGVRPHNDGILRQRQLSDFLYAELLHSLGAYRLSREKFEALEKEMKEERGRRRDRGESSSKAIEVLREACLRGAGCNEGLQLDLHRPGTARHPSPESGSREKFAPDLPLLESIAGFYEVVTAALRFTPPSRLSSKSDEDKARLRELLSVVHDPQRRGQDSDYQDEQMREGRIARTEDRRRHVERLLPEDRRRAGRGQAEQNLPDEAFTALLEDHIQQDGSLHVTILRAMSEAHRWMHVAEHLRRKDFGEMFTGIPDEHAETQGMLRYSHALNTFVFVAAKIVPWAFAEDAEERDLLTEDIQTFKSNCDRLTPTYCLWIATQFSLMAMHRRAFASWTRGKHARAYRDFHKLTRLLRGLLGPAERRAVRVPGTKTFIEGMTAMSELHIGRIYRGQHAHRMALKYFKRSARHLQGWEEHEEIGEIITNSQWRINALLNEAKAHYELGSVKHSLLNYAYAWRAFLCLAESESHATANVDVVNGFIRWLEPLVEEPALSRIELRGRLEPLVEQFEALRSPKHLELLAADIVLRIGHLLYILNLPAARGNPTATKSPYVNHDLARKCVGKAAGLDPRSTLIASDLLKIKAASTDEGLKELKELREPLGVQWPSGGGRFEESARVVEYALHRWLASLPDADEKAAPEAAIARKLLASFLAHTDSSNVKLAQVYRYMMEKPGARQRPTDPNQRTLDLVCLRRYSSFFPFLPRPTAFRSPGGGYFVQARESGDEREPLGIAVDPGPDFIDNLYRCGYALSDIHMIVITHDHSDHITSLDALLSLLRYREGLGDPETFDTDGGRLAVIGNESVFKRYEFFNRPKDKPQEAIRIFRFRDIAAITERDAIARKDRRGGGEFIHKILNRVPTLRIEPVRSWNHWDAARHPSQAFLVSVGDKDARSTVLFTGDTGLPPGPGPGRKYGKGSKSLMEAVDEADVVVAHMSAVPLRELRDVAGLRLGEGEPKEIGEFADLWSEAAEQAQRPTSDELRTESEDVRPVPDANKDLDAGIRQARFLLRQLQFGFRSRPAKRKVDFRVSPLSDLRDIRKQPKQHLYLSGLLDVARRMGERKDGGSSPLLVIGELREELGTFRTRIADQVSDLIFKKSHERPDRPSALTADIGLRVRLAHTVDRVRADPSPVIGDRAQEITVLCTTCDLDNDLVPSERFHPPHRVLEVCVKGEDEGVFYNCLLHHPRRRPDDLWLEAVERYDPFGE